MECDTITFYVFSEANIIHNRNEVLIKRKRIYFITIFPPNPPHRSHGCPLGSHDRTRGGAEATDLTGSGHDQGCSG